MGDNIKKVTDKMQLTEVYHLIMKASDYFCRLSHNIPRALLQVQQNIHGRFDECAYYIFRACNTYDNDKKLLYLSQAKDNVFFQYSSLEYLVRTKVITIGQANEIIEVLSECHKQLDKWHKAVSNNKVGKAEVIED